MYLMYETIYNYYYLLIIDIITKMFLILISNLLYYYLTLVNVKQWMPIVIVLLIYNVFLKCYLEVLYNLISNCQHVNIDIHCLII